MEMMLYTLFQEKGVDSTNKKFLLVQNEGSRSVKRNERITKRF